MINIIFSIDHNRHHDDNRFHIHHLPSSVILKIIFLSDEEECNFGRLHIAKLCNLIESDIFIVHSIFVIIISCYYQTLIDEVFSIEISRGSK